MQISELYSLFKASTGISTDTRKIEKGNLFFALKGPNFNANQLAPEALQKGASYAIIDDEKFVQQNTILVNDALTTLQELANFHRNTFKFPVIGITGTNGKTTTKELISSVLAQKFNTHFTKGNLNNHIGVPLTLLQMPEDTEIAVIEMGANHIGEIEQLSAICNPNFGIITNIGKAHLEGFGSFEGVTKAKTELYKHIFKNGGTLFLNSTDAHLSKLAEHIQAILYPKNDAIECRFVSANPVVVVSINGKIVSTNLVGDYNFPNIAAAAIIGNYFGVSDAQIAKALKEYLPTNNRSQVIKKDSNTIILDAYNANPSSMNASISNFEQMQADRKVLILGDMFELGADEQAEHEKIGHLTSNIAFGEVLFCGKAMKHAHNTNPKSVYFEEKEALKKYLAQKNYTDSTFLIKGSRGIALEEVVEFIN